MKTTLDPNSTPSKPAYQTKGIERCSYGVYFFGQGLIYAIVSQYLMYYYTNYIFLPPLVISGIMFAGKIWDAVNDTLFGLIMDRIHFKSGKKFLPWLKFSTVVVPVGTVLVFSIPASLSMPMRITLAIISYVLWDLFYTICDAPVFALSTAMTSNIKERSTIMTFSSIGGTLAVGVTTILLVPFFDKNGFFKTSLIVAVIAFVTMGMISIFGKERYKVKETELQPPAGLRDTWNYLIHNRYLLLYYLYRIISGCIAVQTLTYVAKYCLGDIKYVSIIAACSIPFILLLYVLSPIIFKRFDKISIFRFCVVAQIVMNLVTFLVGYKNKVALVACMVVIACLAILPTILAIAIPADCVEYGTFKTGIRKEGITFALQTFTNKLGSAFAAAITGVVLSLVGFDATKAITQATIDGLWRWNFLLPILGQSIALILLFFYNLKDTDVQLMADANAGLISHEEAEKRMSRRYK